MSRHTPGHFQTLMTRNDDDGDDDVSVGDDEDVLVLAEDVY